MWRNGETGKRLLFPAFSVPIEGLLVKRVQADADIARLIAKSVSGAIYTFAALTACGTAGLDTKPFIAGLGVTGFTIGFALKDIATNFLSGLMLMAQKPFKNGDVICVAGFTGAVESINTRYLVLKTADGKQAMIPSSIVYSNAVVVDANHK